MTGPAHNWGHPIAYHPVLSEFFGSVNAAIFFGQLRYWSDRTTNPLGVYKTAEEWTTETGLSYREQATARKVLSDPGFVIETNRRLEHRLFFLIDWDSFNAGFADWAIVNRPSLIPQFPNDENAIRGETKAQSGGRQKRSPSIGTETTAETTSETTNTRKRAAPAAPSLPDWIDTEAWAGFVEMRISIRKPMTERAKALAVAKLEALRGEGQSTADVLNQSTMNGWVGLFHVKQEQRQSQRNGNASRHNLRATDYSQGINDDGSF